MASFARPRVDIRHLRENVGMCTALDRKSIYFDDRRDKRRKGEKEEKEEI